MPTLILFDDPILRLQLSPLTLTRPIAQLRCGILTLSEKWQLWLQKPVFYLTEAYLQTKYPSADSDDLLLINGALCPDDALTQALGALKMEQQLVAADGTLLAYRTASAKGYERLEVRQDAVVFEAPVTVVRNPWDVFLQNGAQIALDFRKVTEGRKSSIISDPFTHCYNPENIFIEEGAVIKAVILNAETGPIYIGKDALIQEGSTIQGPFAIGKGSSLAQGTKIRPNTSIGPYSKVGGEVSNSVIIGYSNKGHDGYLGNSVLGEWCNLGANTNNSNLKNDHSPVKLYSYRTMALEDTGIVNCGLIMGDYSKSGISTMFNTGTVVGVNVNVYGAGFQPKHIPSFSWGGGAEGFTPYRLPKALAVAIDTCSRRQVSFGDEEEQILTRIFALSQQQSTQSVNT
ncbi:UDP-N-acetylglucosamine diphosphorylase/glucosamine-1-phosphate N-acetyltransferase [Dyadobacter jejuensis]|uniref:UDP-N-acetylglucosamine diphosphorylase/glucosamine-1-phosphate N-acetyltransferase n=1 Tax=Dyadobacter jejuensis TaxID=1082580 RepID=A0A316AKK6_9BACT|nr:putative sugar nucleotidyl transferase [Dyadobacter jejuensis]PWJ57554.1 UDP-N-acetylglucosamine diphosphorylase/glucosamine-1-phosphate N-acetyltransferase [Dyadobacter jejuensis]